jgi:hypothetical protein
MSETISHDAGGMSAEALGRRALGLDAAWCTAVGAVALVAGGPVGRAVDVPGWLVRAGALGVVGWGSALGVWSVAEAWEPPTRRALAANVAGTAALVGHAAVKGRPAGRIAVLLLAGQAAGFAYAQARALVAAQPHPQHAGDLPPT